MPIRDRILCVESHEAQSSSLEATLSQLGYAVETTTTPRRALELIGEKPFDVVVTELGMNEIDGLTLCRRVRETRTDVPVIIVVSGERSVESAISALHAGAYDFLTKPVDQKLLGISVARAVQHRRLSAEVERLKRALGEGIDPARLEGESLAIKRVNDLVERVATSDVPVLIQGESGTGKERVARALHAASPRRGGPFVALNCATVPPNLLEAELFGQARTSADVHDARPGLFADAAGGTLFLDEISELPLALQPRLLRALQTCTVKPLGSTREVPFDARLLTATQRDLETAVRERRFRQDLFYRIDVVRIDVPPLRDRGNDVLVLASSFIGRACQRSGKRRLQLSPEVAERLTAYDWPGNVRELEGCIERAVALARFEHLTLEDLPENVRTYRADRFVVSANDANEIVPLDELEGRYVVRAIELLGGNKARAAQLLGIDRRSLYRKLERHEARSEVGRPASGNGGDGGRR